MATSLNPLFPIALPPGHFNFRYVGSAPIGSGGLGSVYRVQIVASNCVDNPVGCDRAIKVLNQKWKDHPVMQKRFDREIEALRAMAHRNIVTYHGENLPGGFRFYMMPLFADSLRKYIARGGNRGDWRAVARFGVELAQALDYAHGIGFIHRDFKPDNVLFNGNGPLVVADWGIGYFVHRHSQVLQKLTVGGMGTEYYCSLEQWVTGKSDCRGDIYSLGMTLDEWVRGRQRTINVGDGVSGTVVSDGSAAALHFNALLRAMTHRSKQQRPANMGVVAAELIGVSSY
jgi:serine/threonine protein kinase